ncbi:MAG: transglutaminase domain-containing protein [Polyangia bacterium]
MQRLFAIAAALCALAAGSAARAQTTYDGFVDPGGLLVLEVAADGEVSVVSQSEMQLIGAAADAVSAVPGWLAPALAENLRRLDADLQDELAALIAGAGDQVADEVGWTVAHMAPEDLEQAKLELIAINADMIYEAAPALPYVDLVEVGDGDERYTTCRYSILFDGVEEQLELTREEYYRWVVHPQREDGLLRYIDPSTGGDFGPPDGQFFREYFWLDVFDQRSYRLQVALREPNLIDAELLDSVDFGGQAPAFGPLDSFEVDPIELLLDSETGETVAATFVWGGNGCHSASKPNASGWVYATTVPLEAAAAAGHDELLENMLAAGGGNLKMPYDVLTSNAGYIGSPASVLEVRDRIPFDLAQDPIPPLLESMMYEVEVIDSAAFLETPLVVEELIDPDPESEGDEYTRTYSAHLKLVIPSDQPLALYQALVERSDEVEAFVEAGGILELHLATRPSDDWSGMRMPTGITCAGQSAADASVAIEAGGYPLLAETMGEAEHLWNGSRISPGQGGSGTLPLDDEMTALERLGWWVSQMLSMRIAEQQVWSRSGWVERAVEPERIGWNHFGNCGELQDMLTAAGRTALIPVMPVSTLADDHVWNEFLFADGWHPLQVSWSDAGWHLDDYSVGMDADVSGGKTISGLMGFRGDGWSENLLGRYESEVIDDEDHIDGDYSRHVTLEVTVLDAAGEPVDGAEVMVITEDYYDSSSAVGCAWDYTDRLGLASIPAGENNKYCVQVRSSLGTIGFSFDDPWLTAEETAEGGQVFSKTLSYDQSLMPLPPEPQPAPPDASLEAGDPLLALGLTAEREILRGTSPLSGRTFAENRGAGELDVYVVDTANFEALTAGEPFEAALAETAVSDELLELPVPAGSEWYVAISNARRQAAVQQVFLDVALDTSPADESGKGGCGCRAAGRRRSTRPPWLLLAQLLP